MEIIVKTPKLVQLYFLVATKILQQKRGVSKIMKAAPYSVMLISYGLSIYSLNMCVMKNFSVILLFFTVFCCFYSNISCNNSDKIKDRKVSCKVVPLKARPIIKADVIFSGTVLEVIKKPNLVLNFARRRRRRRRKIGKGKN